MSQLHEINAIPHIIDTEKVIKTPRDSRQGLDFWVDMVCDRFTLLQCKTEQEENFFGSLRSSSLGNIKFTEITSSAQEVHRGPSEISRLPDGEFAINIQISNQSLANQYRKGCAMQVFDLFFYDTTEPFFLSFHQTFKQVVLQIPKAVLSQYISSPEEYSGTHLPSSNSMVYILSQHIITTARQLDVLDASEKAILEPELLRLISYTLMNKSFTGISNNRRQKYSIQQRVKTLIEQQLTDPGLTPQKIADQLGISRRHLYSIFKIPVSKYILNRRLELCALALKDSSHEEKSVTQIIYDYGFNNASHFSKCFKLKYGITALDIRKNRSAIVQHRK